MPRFNAAPFGIAVLMPSRRAVLCWLAALNVEAREWVTRKFPEMLIFEDDPEAWDIVAANLAFIAFVERVTTGLRKDWWQFSRLLMRRVRERRLLTGQRPSCDGRKPTRSCRSRFRKAAVP